MASRRRTCFLRAGEAEAEGVADGFAEGAGEGTACAKLEVACWRALLERRVCGSCEGSFVGREMVRWKRVESRNLKFKFREIVPGMVHPGRTK